MIHQEEFVAALDASCVAIGAATSSTLLGIEGITGRGKEKEREREKDPLDAETKHLLATVEEMHSLIRSCLYEQMTEIRAACTLDYDRMWIDRAKDGIKKELRSFSSLLLLFLICCEVMSVRKAEQR
jgi:hypothetical protein